MKREIRNLTKRELDQLLVEGPDWSTLSIKKLCEQMGIQPYYFLEMYSCERKGIVIDGRPVYFGALIKKDDQYWLWTFINNNIKYHFTIYKIAKRVAHDWARKYKCIYSMIKEELPLQQKWTQRMGFKVVEEKNGSVISRLKEEDNV